jgi:hypothetical protein
VVLVWAATIWGLWSCWLLAQYAKAGVAVTRASATLLVGELGLLAVHYFGCAEGRCSQLADTAGGAATIDLPVLAVVLVAVTATREWRRARRA